MKKFPTMVRMMILILALNWKRTSIWTRLKDQLCRLFLYRIKISSKFNFKADVLSKAAIREREMRARKRRRRKDKAAKLEQEQRLQMILLDDKGEEIEPTPSTSTAAV
jgi:hypothetical protein